MKIAIELANLHSPHFHMSGIGGKNMGDKLDVRSARDIKIEWNTETKQLEVSWNGRIGLIPESNIKSMFPQEATVIEMPVNKSSPIRKETRSTAQVETPQDHVFAGPGAGKTK